MNVIDRDPAPARETRQQPETDERKIVTDERGQDQPNNKSSAQKMGTPRGRGRKSSEHENPPTEPGASR